MRQSVLWMIGLVTMGAASCRDMPGESRTTTTDSAGIRIVQNHARTDSSATACAVMQPARTHIGVLDGPLKYQLGEVADVATTRDGRIAIVNRSMHEARVFDGMGAYLYTLGRNGAGPGEFADPIQVTAKNDSLIVWDWALQRLSVFGPGGHFLNTLSLRPAMANPLHEAFVLEGSRPYWVGNQRAAFPVGNEFAPQFYQVLRFDGTGALVDTVDNLPYGSIGWVNPAAHMYGRPLFESHSALATDGWMLFVGRGDRAEIETRDTSWVLRRVMRWAAADRRVTPADADAYRAEVVGRQRDASMKELFRLRFEKMPAADSFPAIDGLLATRDGSIWVKEFRRPNIRADRWLGFDSAGVFSCRLALPPNFSAFEFGKDYVLGVSTDDNGMHVVERYMFARANDR